MAALSVVATTGLGAKPRRRAALVALRGGGTDEDKDDVALTTPGKKSSSKKKKLLDGGSSSASVSVQLSDVVSRLMRFVRRVYASLVKPSSTATKKKSNDAPRSTASRKAARIAKELNEFASNPPENCKVTMGKNLNVWIVTLTGAKNTLFEGEKFKLRIAFPADYPTVPPSVYFLQPPPRHPHVYTNGDICLNLLGRDWRPNLTVAQLSLSILSMLSSAKQKGIPQDNAVHAATPPGRPQEGWMYHDDSC